ncbi:MAG: BirA family transcriptional regulator [Gaiellaceae bacterium]|nr:BirA family transcriptional regulator [Gaiellaceae bacterium]
MVDSLAPDTVLPLLTGRFGREVYRYEERCASTQRLLREDDPEGAVAATEEQTEGRGRLGRSWVAPAGSSVLFSVLLRPAVPPDRLPELSLVAGRALAAALAAQTGLAAEVKFPNDVLVERRKVAGILAEASAGRVVLGIGVNVSQRAEELPERPQFPATSLALEGATVERPRLLAALLERLELEYDTWLERYGAGG